MRGDVRASLPECRRRRDYSYRGAGGTVRVAAMSALQAETLNMVRQRAAAYAELAYLDKVYALIEEWADLQTERLVREILGRPVAFFRADRDYSGLR